MCRASWHRGFVLSASVAAAAACQDAGPPAPPAPPPPGCRINSIALTPVTKTDSLQGPNCKEDFGGTYSRKYAELCNSAVTDLDAACNTECGRYRKRPTSSPTTPPANEAPVCGPNPVETGTQAFSLAAHCVEAGENRVTIRCTVSGTCTCDP